MSQEEKERAPGVIWQYGPASGYEAPQPASTEKVGSGLRAAMRRLWGTGRTADAEERAEFTSLSDAVLAEVMPDSSWSAGTAALATTLDSWLHDPRPQQLCTAVIGPPGSGVSEVVTRLGRAALRATCRRAVARRGSGAEPGLVAGRGPRCGGRARYPRTRTVLPAAPRRSRPGAPADRTAVGQPAPARGRVRQLGVGVPLQNRATRRRVRATDRPDASRRRRAPGLVPAPAAWPLPRANSAGRPRAVSL